MLIQDVRCNVAQLCYGAGIFIIAPGPVNMSWSACSALCRCHEGYVHALAGLLSIPPARAH